MGVIPLPSERAMREELEAHRQLITAEGKGKGAFHVCVFIRSLAPSVQL